MGLYGDFLRQSRTRERSQMRKDLVVAGFSNSIVLITWKRTGWEEKEQLKTCTLILTTSWPTSFNGDRWKFLLFETKDQKICHIHFRQTDGVHLPLETSIHPSVPVVVIERFCGSSLWGTDSRGRFILENPAFSRPSYSTAKRAGCKFPASDEEDGNEAWSKGPFK